MGESVGVVPAVGLVVLSVADVLGRAGGRVGGRVGWVWDICNIRREEKFWEERGTRPNKELHMVIKPHPPNYHYLAWVSFDLRHLVPGKLVRWQTGHAY